MAALKFLASPPYLALYFEESKDVISRILDAPDIVFDQFVSFPEPWAVIIPIPVTTTLLFMIYDNLYP
jgi:hypothetical protein